MLIRKARTRFTYVTFKKTQSLSTKNSWTANLTSDFQRQISDIWQLAIDLIFTWLDAESGRAVYYISAILWKAVYCPVMEQMGDGGYKNDDGEKFKNFADNPFDAHRGIALPNYLLNM